MFTIKRKSRILVCFLIHDLLLWMSMVLCVDGQQGCVEVTYLEVGQEGIISCSLEPFYAVSWYTKESYDQSNSPLLYVNEKKHGSVDEYDVHTNGSFIFRNVTFGHAGSYIVSMLQSATSNSFVREVSVRVYVTPDPTYPVIEGHISQQRVYMDVSRNGQLSCSMRGIYPNISLEWTVVDPSQSKMILFQDGVVERKQNKDNTFDIALTSLYEVTDQSVRRITIQCGVANEIGEVLFSRAEVDFLFSSVYPVVNGYVNQKHVFLDVNREGHLTCFKEKVDNGTRLAWKIVGLNMLQKVTFQSSESISNNDDGSVNINQSFDFEVHDHSLERITIECRVLEPDSDEHAVATKVDLLFQNVYPVVNGHINQKRVYLDVERQGQLTCFRESVDAGTALAWDVLDTPCCDKISFQSHAIILTNQDGTVNINQTFDYVVQDLNLGRITMECRVIERDSNEHPYFTKVVLLFGNGGDSNNMSTHGTSVVISLSILLMVALHLIVIILLCLNRKMYKKHLAKFLPHSVDKLTHNEESVPVGGTNGTTSYCTANGGPVRCSSDVCDADIQEVQDINESLESPDSGNSGRNSRELSGSEASEKSHLMDDIEMSCNNYKEDPLHVNKEGFEGTPVV